MPQNQHVIAEWLLKLFARTEPGGLTLSVFDKVWGDRQGRAEPVLDDHVRVVRRDGSLLRELVLDASRDYQPRLHSAKDGVRQVSTMS